MKAIIRECLGAIGLLDAARGVKRYLSARGSLKWDELVPAEAFSESCQLAIGTLQELGHDFGDYLEFGVSRGTSMACMYNALRRAGLENVRLLGFDSFEGLPPEAQNEGWGPGQFASTQNATKSYLKRAGVDLSKVTLIKGWYDDTLTPETRSRFEINKASLIMMDCDIYSSTQTALAFSASLIADAAILFFDDWGWKADKGEIGQQNAWAEFLEANPQFSAKPLPAYIPQARLFLVTRNDKRD